MTTRAFPVEKQQRGTAASVAARKAPPAWGQAAADNRKRIREAKTAPTLAWLVAKLKQLSVEGYGGGPIAAGDGWIIRELADRTGLEEKQVASIASQIGLWNWTPSEVIRAARPVLPESALEGGEEG